MTDFAWTLARLEPVGRAFHEAGHELHLVGGMVRDVLLGSSVGDGADLGDFDLTTDARPEQSRALLAPIASAIWDQGARFGTIGAKIGEAMIEVTTYRSESYVPDSRKPEVNFGDDLDTDLSRRDFTINAMAVSVTTGALVDPYGGHADLVARHLRTPSAPEVSFVDDPLRMLRAARFIPRFGLDVDPGLERAAAEQAGRLQIVSAERIREELERLLAVDRPRSGIEFLVRNGLAEFVVPGLDSAAWLEAAAGLERTADRVVRRALLLSSLGSAGAATRLDRLRYSRHDAQLTVRLLELSECLRSAGTDDESVRRLIVGAGRTAEPELVDRAVELTAALDDSARPTPFESALAGLRGREDLTDFGSPLTGGEIMQELGIGPGRRVGEALDHLRELRIRKGPLSSDEARTALKGLVFDDPEPTGG